MLASFLPPAAYAELLFTENYPVEYGDGTALGANQTIGGYNIKWPSGNSTGTGNPICTSAGALVYEPLAPISENPSYGFRCATSGSRDQSAGFSTVSGDGNSVYGSFLIKVTADVPVPRNLIGLRNSTGGGTLALAVGINASRQLTLAKANTLAASATAALNVDEVYLVVFRYRFLAGSGTDECALWLNPATGQTDEVNAGVTPIVTASGSDQNSLLSVRLPSTTDASGPLYLDEIRVGTTWADVTPLGGPLVGQKLGFTSQPTITPPGGIISPVVVQIQTANGAAVASNGVPVTLSLTGGNGILSGTLTVETDSEGKATFSDLSIDTAGIGKQLTATASGIGAGLTAGTSAVFAVVEIPIGSKLAFTTPPVNGVINVPLNTIIVQIQDANGVAAASNAVPITLTLSSGSGNLIGTVTQNTDNTGKAQFNGLTIDDVGEGKQLTATAGGSGAGLAEAVSPSFAITLTPVGAKLGFATQPASTSVNASLNSIVVQIQDANSGAVPSNGVPVSLALTLGSGTLNGTLTQLTDDNGRATFSDLSIDTVGPAKQLTATASGSGTGLAAAASSVFAITGAVVASPPVITQAVATASSMILRGTNGVPGVQYQVLTATNPAQPAAEWIPVQTNVFTGGGNFDCTIAVSPGSRIGFYRLLTAGGAAGRDFSHVGFAARLADGSPFVLSGGTNGSVPLDNIVTVTNFAQLGEAISNTAPLIIQVQGTIHMRTNGNFYLRANKTLIGLGSDATLVGCLAMYGNAPGGHSYAATNIIIRNLTIRNPDGYGEDDAIAMKYGARNIWIDHCTIYDASDGLIDMTRECDFVTISWCHLFYSAPNGHENSILVGGNDGDTMDIGKSHITLHHNWFGALAKERMPSVRFGRAHVFNNYFNSPGNRYCTRTRLYAEVLVENNFYDNVQNPWELATSTLGPNGKLRASGNITNNCVFTTAYSANLPNGGVVILVDGSDTLSSGPNQLNPPPYAYTLDATMEVPAVVQANAGAGRGPFAP